MIAFDFGLCEGDGCTDEVAKCGTVEDTLRRHPDEEHPAVRSLLEKPPRIGQFPASEEVDVDPAAVASSMAKEQVPSGTVHTLPSDLRDALVADSQYLDAWMDITPLARNEWICWVDDAKRDDTRQKRIRQAQENLADGKRRPCCWPGCSHRDKDGS